MAFDIHQAVTDKIVAAIEAGAAGEWTCPWHRRGGGLPTNALTGRAYRGVNVLSLWCAEQASGYSDSRWATYRQWAELGAQVRKGEKSSIVIFYRDYAAEGDDGEDERRFVARASYAFNADQVDGAPAADPAFVPSEIPDSAMDAMAARTGARIVHGGEQACYVPSLDEVRMPERGRFRSPEGYASTLAHELVHWTGAPGRLARDLTGRFRTHAYAAEELVAELGAAFAMASLGMAAQPHPHHASYIAGWLTLLRSDNRAIFTAAAAANRAVDYMLSVTEGSRRS